MRRALALAGVATTWRRASTAQSVTSASGPHCRSVTKRGIPPAVLMASLLTSLLAKKPSARAACAVSSELLSCSPSEEFTAWLRSCTNVPMPPATRTTSLLVLLWAKRLMRALTPCSCIRGVACGSRRISTRRLTPPSSRTRSWLRAEVTRLRMARMTSTSRSLLLLPLLLLCSGCGAGAAGGSEGACRGCPAGPRSVTRA
mmetsp:Transcript_25237/g.70597  ORF Transcript_25237/g.70597 Transcript_25237/m.70597 type:complete len:201 (+) Transcript_25237:1464-2066(+)